MELKKAIIVIADISGYTKFVTLHTMSLLHAEKIVTELMETIIDSTSEPLVLNKLEGDAVLFYADAGESEADAAKSALKQSLSFFDAFNKRSKELTGCNNMCPCDACRQADQLRLKTVLHTGEIAVKRVRNFEEIAGEAVIAAHSLLKNSIETNEYILMTKSFAELSNPSKAVKTEARTESPGGIAPVEVEVYYPDRDEEDIPPEQKPKQKFLSSLTNSLRLNSYSLARLLRLKKAPSSKVTQAEPKPGFFRFCSDTVRGLWMAVRGK